MLRHLGLHINIRDDLETHQKIEQKWQQAAAAFPSAQTFPKEAGGPEGHQADIQLPQGQSNLEFPCSPDMSLLAAFSRRQEHGCWASAFLCTDSCCCHSLPGDCPSQQQLWEGREEKGQWLQDSSLKNSFRVRVTAYWFGLWVDLICILCSRVPQTLKERKAAIFI